MICDLSCGIVSGGVGLLYFFIDIDIVEFLLRAYRQWRMVNSAGLKSVLLSKAQPAARNSGAVEISDVRRIWWRIML